MPYTIGDLDREIDSKAQEMLDNNGKHIHKGWLVNAVMRDHDSITGDDADFAVCLAHAHVTKRVEHYFRRIKEAEQEGGTDDQLILPGYEKLQRRYIVTRDEAQVGIDVWDLTDDELDAKAHEHRAMGRGHFQHADELDRFRAERAASSRTAG